LHPDETNITKRSKGETTPDFNAMMLLDLFAKTVPYMQWDRCIALCKFMSTNIYLSLFEFAIFFNNIMIFIIREYFDKMF